VTLLPDLLDAIASIAFGVEEGSRPGRIARASDIEPFIASLEELGGPRGVHRCGSDSFCLGRAVLVYDVEALLTPEGEGIADVAVRQLEDHGVAIERVGQPHVSVLSVAGSTAEGWLEGRIIAPRGWVFLVSAPTESESRALADILDRAIVGAEGSSTR
jgi:hypothetical protein